mgnify:CR=1 FL=1
MARRPHGEASLRRVAPAARIPLRRGTPCGETPRAEMSPCRDVPVPSHVLYRPVSPMTSAAERQGRSRDGPTST